MDISPFGAGEASLPEVVFRSAANLATRLPRWVKMRNTHREQMFSALPPTSDIESGLVALLS
jgi:hypothetical protein